ncbi:MAG: YicC family protein [Myxococcota bacterium]|nr:YicC family protein [Myxococcota bacterium]
MTGFGAGEASFGAGRLTLELRALNHRHTEIRVRMPSELLDHGGFVEQLARERLGRGRFDVGVRLSGGDIAHARFSRERARSLYTSLLELRDALAPGAEVPFTAVTALPELITTPPDLDTEGLREALRAAFEYAQADLDAMRVTEGRALSADIRGHLERCQSLSLEIGQRAAGLVDAQRARLTERLQRLLDGANLKVDAARLEQELAIYADKSDIAEELSRLTSHFEFFASALLGEGAVGRRLEFVLQEIGRESNTIASKCQDAPIAQLVVELKTEIERIREQVQNVE